MAVPLVNPDGTLQVSAAGEILLGEDGDPCCCGDGGGGGDRYRIYFHRYCTYPECSNFIYVWSDEIAYGDVLWRDAVGGWFKFGGVCFEVWTSAIEGCEEWGPSCVESIRYGGQADGPALSGDIGELCGPCCGQYGEGADLCRRSTYWSCAEQEYKCYECGEEDSVYVRATNTITQTLSPEYIANQDALFAGDPNYISCWNGGLILDLRESILFRVDWRLSAPDGNGCQSLEATCLQGDYAWRQGQWFWWNFGNPPSCLWQVDSGGSDVCGDHSWRASRCGADINPFTGIENDFPALCSFATSGTDQSGNAFTRVFERYQDGAILSITDTITTYFMTQDRFGNPIPHMTEVRVFTYIRQLTVITPCDSDSRRRCEARATCSDGANRPAPMAPDAVEMARGVPLRPARASAEMPRLVEPMFRSRARSEPGVVYVRAEMVEAGEDLL